MAFARFLREQMTVHPATQPQDVVKQCYQTAFGAEHLLGDLSAAKAYFEEEYMQASDKEVPLFECIAPDVCRVNLLAWKHSEMPADWLFRMFVLTAKKTQCGSESFLRCLSAADDWIRSGDAGIQYSEWETYLTKYRAGGMCAVHHSAEYRAQESPACRIVNHRLIRLLPVLQRIAANHGRSPFVMALDGRAASGKTTMAADLGFILSGSVIHMDDFFLPAEMRTADRLEKLGGNVHYERFADEVLPQLRKGKHFSYRVFDCEQMGYEGTREVAASLYYIIEGFYSCHSAFGGYADLKIFVDVDREEQMSRIVRRNGAEMAERFRSCWIPMEEEYFRTYRVKENADIVL